MSGFDRFLRVSTSGIHQMDTLPGQTFMHDLYADSSCGFDSVVVPKYAARYALLVRILVLVMAQFAPVVRTLGSQSPCANLGGPPVEKC